MLTTVRMITVALLPILVLGLAGGQFIRVSSTPSGADIFLDGQPTGLTTPAKLSFREMSVGEHRVTVHLPGYTDIDRSFFVIEKKSLIVWSCIPPVAFVMCPIQFFGTRWKSGATPNDKVININFARPGRDTFFGIRIGQPISAEVEQRLGVIALRAQ